MGAGDDLLTGVAAFLEADAFEQIDIQHLGDEALVGPQPDLGQSGADVRNTPRVQGRRVVLHRNSSGRYHQGSCRNTVPAHEARAIAFDVRAGRLDTRFTP